MELKFPAILPAPKFFLEKFSSCNQGEIPDFFECEKRKRQAREAKEQEAKIQDTMQEADKELAMDKSRLQEQSVCAEEPDEDYLSFAIEDDVEIPLDDKPESVANEPEKDKGEEYLPVEDEQKAIVDIDKANSLDKDIDTQYLSIPAKPKKHALKQTEKKSSALKSPQLRTRVLALLQRHEMKIAQEEDIAETPGLIDMDMPHILIDTPLEVLKGKEKSEDESLEISVEQTQNGSIEEVSDEELDSIEELSDEELDSIEELDEELDSIEEPDEELDSIEEPDEELDSIEDLPREKKNTEIADKLINASKSIGTEDESNIKELSQQKISMSMDECPDKYDCLLFKDDPQKDYRILGKCAKNDGLDYLLFSQKSWKIGWFWLLLTLAGIVVVLYKFTPKLLEKITKGEFP